MKGKLPQYADIDRSLLKRLKGSAQLRSMGTLETEAKKLMQNPGLLYLNHLRVYQCDLPDHGPQRCLCLRCCFALDGGDKDLSHVNPYVKLSAPFLVRGAFNHVLCILCLCRPFQHLTLYRR